METAVIERPAVGPPLLDFSQAAGVVSTAFAWKPGPVARALVAALSRVMKPLEQGSYEGRALSGEPHRASWVIASPLNVFVVPRSGYWRRVVLAARLRHTGRINVVELGPEARDGGRCLVDLITIQRDSAASIRLIPVARTSHQLSGAAPNVSAASKAYRVAPQQVVRLASSLVRTARTGRVKNCRPLVLSSWLESRDAEDVEQQAAELRVVLMGNVESQRRACAGPPAMPTWEVKRRVLADPVLASYMHEHELRKGEAREAVLAEAKGYVDEIASDYRVGVVRWFTRAVDFMFDRFLTDVEVDREGIRFLSECDSSSRIALICCHKSYIDPLLLGYVMFRSGLVPPQQAAGRNLDFWPVGWLLRHSGAFYLRRTFAGETLYREVFSAYVRYLLAENHIIVVYIEGTRSRDGKLAMPKTGFLGVLDESIKMGICPDIKLVPTYLGYDKVPEESAHVKEMSGGRKVSESVKGFGRIYKSINTRLGRAYVKFGTPLSLKRLVTDEGLEGAAFAASEGINRITPVTARSLAACALLASGGTWVPVADFERNAEVLADFAERAGCPMALDADGPGVSAAADWLAAEGHVARQWQGPEEGYVVEGNGRRFLEYNKNIPLHHFAAASLEAVLLRGRVGDTDGTEREREGLAFLRDLLDHELVFGPAEGPGGSGVTFSDEAAPVLASLIESCLEAYAAAARTSSSIGASISRDDLVERCLGQSERMLRDGEIGRPESGSKTAMVNAVRKFVAMDALEQRRSAGADGKDSVLLSHGPRFDELASIEKKLLKLRV